MIFMGMGEDEADDVVALFFKEADIRKNDIDAGFVLAAEGDAHVDDQPRIRPFPAIAVQIEVHADLADAAERYEDERVFGSGVCSGHGVRPRRTHRRR